MNAEALVLDQNYFELDPQRFAAFQDMLDNPSSDHGPPPPHTHEQGAPGKQRMRRLAKRLATAGSDCSNDLGTTETGHFRACSAKPGNSVGSADTNARRQQWRDVTDKQFLDFALGREARGAVPNDVARSD